MGVALVGGRLTRVIRVCCSGTHYEVGYLYVALLANETTDNYNSLVNSLTKNNTLLNDLLGIILDWQYNSYLVHGLPQAYLDEFQGAADAAAAYRVPTLATVLQRGIVREVGLCVSSRSS